MIPIALFKNFLSIYCPMSIWGDPEVISVDPISEASYRQMFFPSTYFILSQAVNSIHIKCE